MTQATTVTPRAAELPETVLTPVFAEIHSKNLLKRRNFVKKYKEKE
jgi:hypothetical protein